MLEKVKEKVKEEIAVTEEKIRKNRTSSRLKKLDPNLYCSVCKQAIRRGDFIAVMGKNTLLPALYEGSIKHSYAWLLGTKKYCGKCFEKEYRK